MPSARGLVFAVFHALVLTVGLVRDELGVVVWGGGLLLVELVVIVTAALTGARLRAVRAHFATELEQPVVEEGDATTVRVAVPSLPLIPGFTLEHIVDLDWGGRRRLRARSLVDPGGERRWSLRAAQRGDFRTETTRLELRDAFGFTVTAVTDASPLRLVVVPAEIDLDPDVPVYRGGDRAAVRSTHRVRSDELREVRPYVPGDDVRRLSWKHLAAHREFLIRIGETIPPSRGEIRCRIDGFVPSGHDPDGVGDALMRALRAVVRTADERGANLECRFTPGRDLSPTPEALAGFAPGGELVTPPRDAVVAPSGPWFTITARDDARGAHLSVASLLEPDRPDAPRWRRMLLREAP